MLLDTHIWLWGAEGERRRIGSRTVREIERARTRRELYVSTASIFEISALHLTGRIELTSSPEVWVRDSIEAAGLKVVDISGAIAIDAGSIPAAALADPCDRLLVASARHRSVPFVTRDSRILDYARATRSVRVVDARR